MAFFNKLLKKKTVPIPSECTELYRLRDYMASVLNKNGFIARSEYRHELPVFQNTVEFFHVLINSGQITKYCKKYGVQSDEAIDIIDKYSTFDSLVDENNERYVEKTMSEEKSYLDRILYDIDPDIVLDDDQRRVVLCDEDYTLVIAGAGAGKSTTVEAKVKYLVDKKGIDPKEILVISFTNKAVNELKDKINKLLQIDCPVATFHSVGNAVLHKQNPQKLCIVDDNKIYFVLLDYFRNSVLKDENMVKKLIMFFASYFDAPFEGDDLNNFFNNIAKSNFSTLRSDLNEFKQNVIDARTKKSVTIQSEILRSYQEVEIANFLYLNGIDYEYEPVYKYNILFSRKPYTPDFVITQGDNTAYIEHFGITEDGKNDRYSLDQLQSYKKAIRDKIALHRQHGTKLICTYSSYKDRRPIIDHLREELENAGFVLFPRPQKDVLNKLVVSEENRYIRRLVMLMCRFIKNSKTNGYDVDEFNRMYHSTQNVRTRLFLDICQECYLQYQRYLKESGSVDFEDMINESARVLQQVSEMKQKLDFKYIIVDEYQDISKQRFDLVKALHNVTDAKIMAVGDDWQSIYAFSGSDITLFTKFEEIMGYAKLMKIVRTYRNSQEIIDIAGDFIQKNTTQIKKALISSKHIEDPIIIYTYDNTPKKPGGTRKSGSMYSLARAVETALDKAVETAIDQIVKYNNTEGKKKNSSILLIGRFNFDGDMLERTGLFEYTERGKKLKSLKYPFLDITFMTAHASKGLSYDNVIIINGKNETYGFPAKIEDDPVLSFVVKDDHSIDYAEERRLFYVAMTRTRNRVFFIAPKENPSEFLLEIKNNYKTVILNGIWNEEPPTLKSTIKKCPLCGYPMQHKYKRGYGLDLYICTNEPEICGFMTNEPKAGKLSVIKCDKCSDGYLIVKLKKASRNGPEYFLGCTNYKEDKTGCGGALSKDAFYSMMGYDPDTEPAEEFAERIVHSNGNKQANTAASSSNQHENVTEIPFFETETTVEYSGKDLNVLVHTVLSALNHISRDYFFGANVLADVLRGDKSEKVIKRHLDIVTEFGAFADISREDIMDIVYFLIQNNFILRTKEKYPVLHQTYKGLHYNDEMTVGMLKKLKKYLEES